MVQTIVTPWVLVNIVDICSRTMTFSVIFVDRLVVVVRQIVSIKTRKDQNTWNERSERMSNQTAETVKDVRVLVSFYAARGDGNVSNEPVYKEKFCVPGSDLQLE